ncbi:hypothetical protein ACPCTO_34070 [Streptomyces olivoreticuli]
MTTTGADPANGTSPRPLLDADFISRRMSRLSPLADWKAVVRAW